MDRYFDPTIPTELRTERNIRVFLGLLLFWSIGGLYPLVFWPHSYTKITELEYKRFPDDERFKFDRHLYSNEVYTYLDKFAKFYSHKVKIFTLSPPTFEGRVIKVVRLQLPKEFRTKKKGNILIVCTLMATLWDSASACLDIMHKLCEECHYKDPYLRDYDWYIIPLFNPDGYDYTLTERDLHPHMVLGPKNRVYYISPDNPAHCYGVYLNRNFGFHWGESKKVDYSNYCWEGFSGVHPFSENETIAIRSFVESMHKRRKPITMYIQVHGSRHRDDVTYPWRFTTQGAFNQPVLDSMAKTAAEVVNNATGASFTYIQSGRRDLASGLLADWLMGIMHVVYIFSIEPTFEVANSTELPDQQIYIEKVSTILFTLAKELRTIQSSANYLSTDYLSVVSSFFTLIILFVLKQ